MKPYQSFERTLTLSLILTLAAAPLILSAATIIFNNNLNKEVMLEVEIANNYSKRKLGLMHRDYLPQNSGMIFIWEDDAIRCMWMKNTYIPLDLVFLDQQSTILSKHNLVPNSEESICSKHPARFAIEVNAGWLKQNGIDVGSKITFKK